MPTDPYEIQRTILTTLGGAISAQVQYAYPDQRIDVVWAEAGTGKTACVLKLRNGELWALRVERIEP